VRVKNLACREEILLAVENGEDGAVVSAYTGKGSSGPRVQLELHLHLSPEFDSNRFSRQNLLVLGEGDAGEPALLFVPLTETLAIIEVKKNNDTGVVVFGQIKFLRPSEVRCSPGDVFVVESNVFAVCANVTSNSVFVLNVILDRNHLNKTRCTYTNDLYLSESEGRLSNRTNFLHVDYLGYHFILFGIGRSLYSMRPYVFSETRMRDIPETHCDSLRWLATNEGTKIWAYCGDSVVNYDVGIEDWREAFTLQERGISIPCQQEGMEVNVFSSFINVTRHGGAITIIRKEGQNFVSGVCTGSADRSYLVYVDEIAGVILVDLSSSRSTLMSSGASCKPPLVVASKYVIIRGVSEGVVLVLDAHNISRTLLEVQDVLAPVVTLVTLPCPKAASEPVRGGGGGGLQVESSHSLWVDVELTVGLAVVGVALIVLTMACVALAVLWHWGRYVHG